MRNLSLATVLFLLVAACGGTVAGTTKTSPPVETTTTPAPPVTTAAPPTSPSTTTVVETTTTSPPAASGAQFVLSTISLGDSRMVVITNVGDEAGSLGGHWLCRRPQYYEFPDVEVPAGQSAAVSVGGTVFIPPPGAIVIDGVAGIGPFSPAGGEVGLYTSNSFSSSDDILSYVEWGESGHARSPVAVSAGIWPVEAFVETTADTTVIIANQLPALEPDDWTGA